MNRIQLMEGKYPENNGYKVLRAKSPNSDRERSYRYEPTQDSMNTTAIARTTVNTYLGYDDSGAKVSVDVIPKSIIGENESLFRNGITAHSSVKLDQVLRIKDLIETETAFYVITDAFDGKSLEELLKEGKKLSEKNALEMVKRIAEVFCLVEKESMTNEEGEKMILMHRNIKPKNIVFHEGKAKLRGFGRAKLVAKDVLIKDTVGTLEYKSPQVLSRGLYTYKRDIWALGVLLYLAVVGEYPWKGSTEQELLKAIETCPLSIPSTTSKAVALLIESMLQIKEKDRIDWGDILKHPAFSILEDYTILC